MRLEYEEPQHFMNESMTSQRNHCRPGGVAPEPEPLRGLLVAPAALEAPFPVPGLVAFPCFMII